MIRDITLGQYYASDSPIHRLDPRVKIIATLLFIIELFIVDNFIGFGICAAVLAAVIIVSKVPLSFIMRGLKPILFILFFTFALNIFMVKGEVIWEWKFLHITREGIQIAVFMAIRLVLLIIGSSMLTLTTKPLSLTDGIERLLSPLARFKFPSHEIAMMMTMMKRAKALIPVLVPLFVSAFRIAQDLAMAMEARCYHGGENRTRMHEMKLRTRDFVAFALEAIFLALIIIEARMF